MTDDLTPDSAAVRLYAAARGCSVEFALTDLQHLVGSRADWERCAAEHERLCASRIAAAEKAARVGALEEAACEADAVYSGWWSAAKFQPDIRPDWESLADGAMADGERIRALITAAEAQPVKDPTHG